MEIELSSNLTVKAWYTVTTMRQEYHSERCLTRDEFREVLKETLEEHYRLTIIEHGDHHAWLKHELERQRLRLERNRKLIETLATWSLIGSLGWFASLVSKYIVERYLP